MRLAPSGSISRSTFSRSTELTEPRGRSGPGPELDAPGCRILCGQESDEPELRSPASQAAPSASVQAAADRPPRPPRRRRQRRFQRGCPAAGSRMDHDRRAAGGWRGGADWPRDISDALRPRFVARSVRRPCPRSDSRYRVAFPLYGRSDHAASAADRSTMAGRHDWQLGAYFVISISGVTLASRPTCVCGCIRR